GRIGGGGHPQAASAGYRDLKIAEALARVREALEAEVRPPLRASDIMSAPVRTTSPETTMRAAGEIMAKWGHGGLPVLEGDKLVGIVTRKDVDKAVRHGLDHAPVTGFMTRDVITARVGDTLMSLEHLLAARGIGRVPVMDDGQVVGIVTRKDLLQAEHGDAYLDRRMPQVHSDATERFLASFGELLPGDVREAVTRIGSLAESRGVRAHLVGGIVRDLLLGRQNLDVDVVIEGDAIEFAEEVGAQVGARVRPHRRFGTAVIVMSKDFHIDVTSARSEYYTRPGALPTVERSSLRQDLFRRDFTINAMAACVNPECLGRIADPFGGLRDLESGVVRVLHALSFVEDPTRLLRAARFEVRYGFHMSETTEEIARRAVEMRLLEEVSGARIREELLDIYAEKNPTAVLERLDALDALEGLVPSGVQPADALAHVASGESSWRELTETLPRAADRIGTLLVATSAGATRESAERWVNHVRLGREYARPIVGFATRGRKAQRRLSDERPIRERTLYRLLQAVDPEVLVVLWAIGNGLVRERIEHYLRDLARIKPAVSGADLLELGYAPSERFSDILARALDARIDGRAVGREAELANLARLAARAGLERADQPPEES
ncbi:MAG: CBS domain-containing protein, partial [Coriobacteriales bacterium]|nr:CBS domain-containing protein [Coriobacteriales bacterium]